MHRHLAGHRATGSNAAKSTKTGMLEVSCVYDPTVAESECTTETAMTAKTSQLHDAQAQTPIYPEIPESYLPSAELG